MHFHPAVNVDSIAQELQLWNAQHAAPVQKSIQPHPNERDARRRLKIGYVSPDFRAHVVGRALLPLLSHHDRSQFEITFYSNVARPDAMTKKFQSLADNWRNIFD